MSLSPLPIDHSYWVKRGGLLAGEYPRTLEEGTSKEKIQALEDAGVTAFIDLTEERELFPYAQMLTSASHHRFPIRDVSVPTTPDTVIAALDTIDRQMARGRTVYVHCWGGVGRTGVIVGCWLVRHGEPGPAALDRLRKLFSHCPKASHRSSPETAEQEQYILNWRDPSSSDSATRSK